MVKKTVEFERGQRAQLGDFQLIGEDLPVEAAQMLGESFLVNPDDSAEERMAVIKGFGFSNPSGKVVQIDKGIALAGFRKDGGEVSHGLLITEGEDSKSLDLTSLGAGTYTVYVRFQFENGPFENRIFWDANTPGEYTNPLRTTKVADWALAVTEFSATSPGDEWLKICEVDQATMALTDKRRFYFEGQADGELDASVFPSTGSDASMGPSFTTGGENIMRVYTPPDGGNSRVSDRMIGAQMTISGAATPSNNQTGIIVAAFSGGGTGDDLWHVNTTALAGGNPDANDGSISYAWSDPYGNDWGFGNDKDKDRGTNGVGSLKRMIEALTTKIREIQWGAEGSDFTVNNGNNWWSTPPLPLSRAVSILGSTLLDGTFRPKADQGMDLGNGVFRIFTTYTRRIYTDSVLPLLSPILSPTTIGDSGNRFDQIWGAEADLSAKLQMASNPAPNTGITNQLHAMNVPKAWGRLTLSGGGDSWPGDSSFNIDESATVVTDTTLTFFFADALADAECSVLVTVHNTSPGPPVEVWVPHVTSTSTASFAVQFFDMAAAGALIGDMVSATPEAQIHFVVFGKQT